MSMVAAGLDDGICRRLGSSCDDLCRTDDQRLPARDRRGSLGRDLAQCARGSRWSNCVSGGRMRRARHLQLIEVEICRFVGAKGESLAKVEVQRAAATNAAAADPAAGNPRGHGERCRLAGDHGSHVPAGRSAGAVGDLLGAVRRSGGPAASPRQPQPSRALLAGHRRGVDRPQSGLVRNGGLSRRAGRGDRHRQRSAVGGLQELALPLGCARAGRAPSSRASGRVLGAFAFYFP